MHIDDTISEFFGALANMVKKNNSGKLQESDVLAILVAAKIETPKGDNYKDTKGLIKKAMEYWTEKDRPSVVNNIRDTLS
jgi:hypothetical protein